MMAMSGKNLQATRAYNRKCYFRDYNRNVGRVITLFPRGKADTPIEKSRNATPAMVIGLCMRESAGLTVMTMIGLRRHTNLSECVQSLSPGGNVAI